MPPEKLVIPAVLCYKSEVKKLARRYIKRLFLRDEGSEWNFFVFGETRTCFSTQYPFGIFPRKELEIVDFDPITIFYGGNGSGKSTLLNIIAELAGVKRNSPFSSSSFFPRYLEECRLTGEKIPQESEILTSDDISDYLLELRRLNGEIDDGRQALFDEYLERKDDDRNFISMEYYDDWKRTCEAKSKSMSRFVRNHLAPNVNLASNGESAVRFFQRHIRENALYLLDEPENSLSIAYQEQLRDFLVESARHFGCQFVISTHSPILLSIRQALIYDLDSVPVRTKRWTELENVRKYFDFFEEHRNEFLKEETPQ